MGIYRIHDSDITGKPAIDIDRLARGAQVLAGIVAVCATLVALRRHG
ncbi:MAG: hypothetical protein R2761_02395 [Acidimicrobiales bacterium]